MTQTVVLNLGQGNLSCGLDSVVARIGHQRPLQVTGQLPAAPDLAQQYAQWQGLYQSALQQLNWSPRIEIADEGNTHFSEAEFERQCQSLQTELNRWLRSNTFQTIEHQLRTALNPNEEIQVLIETRDPILQQLPWHLWQFFEDYPKAEMALSAPEYRAPQVRPNRSHKLRILAILGNTTGIRVNQDRAFLESLHQAQVEFLVEPTPDKLNDRLWEKGWDILFFAGHSSEKTGLQLNREHHLSLEQLRQGLKKSIRAGLKLAIFNSCDGLGLARSLFDLHIPQVIVMREPVPDAVAQEFLRYFLKAFFQGQSLFTAVREARERLDRPESPYPCAGWLPLLCQNPAAMPFRLPGVKPKPPVRWRVIATSGALSTAFVIALRILGLLQLPELWAYDRFLTLRPTEPVDNRLLVVTVTEADIQKYQQWPLSDELLAKVLQKLEQHQPHVIGLDLYRDYPVGDGQAALIPQLQSPKLVAVCSLSSGQKPGVAPPSLTRTEQQGFSDVVLDEDGVLRRQFLYLTPDPDSPCRTSHSLSLRVAQRYLADQEIYPQLTEQEHLQLGDRIFPPLTANTGGYRGLDARGYQLMINFRLPQQTAFHRVTLSEVLTDAVNPDWIQDRTVLIGMTADTVPDRFRTPAHSATEATPGVMIHAQMVSQLLSHVIDGRTLIWSWPDWAEAVWIGLWSLVGSGVMGVLRSQPKQLMGLLALLLELSFCCWLFLLFGGWIPLIPAGLGVIAAAVVFRILQRQG